MFSVVQWTWLAGVLKMLRLSKVFKDYTSIKPLNKKINIINSLLCRSVPLLMFIQTLALEKWEPAGRKGDIAKSPRMLRSSWILNELSLYCKIVKYCFLSKVCMIKTVSITGREDSSSRVGHALRPIFMLWLVKIWQVSSCGKFMQHLKSCLLWQLKLTEFCVNLGCF